jgi:predicted ATPase
VQTVAVSGGTGLVAPARTAELFGREADAARLAERLRRHRLVTLTGPGGVGKTHLAFATTKPGDLGQPVFCALSEVTDPHAVRHAVAASLDIAVTAEPLGTKVPPPPDGDRVLLLLDNCEHVLDAAAAAAEELLAADHVAVLATSREPLQLHGEQVVTLAPLAVPDPAEPPETAAHAPAVELFAARATAVRDDFKLDESTLPAVAEVCRALDGLPLALEIAAARVRSLSVDDVAARLVRRFTLLRSSTRSRPARHRSLHAVVEWSYGLLDDEEQALFDMLAVFTGGCDVDAVSEVCTHLGLDREPLDLVDSLVARSLVTAAPARGGTRYSMLDTLRAYGLERLEATNRLDAARDLQADIYARVYGRMHDLGRRAWTPALVPLFDEFDNARSALDRALAVDASPDRAYEILAPLWYLALQQRPGEIAELADRALQRWGRAQHPQLSEVLATAATARFSVDEVEAGAALARAAVEADTSPVGVAWAWGALARADKRTGDPERALARLDAADRAAEAAGFEPYRCDLMGHRVTVLHQAGRDDDAIACARDTLAMAERQGNAYEHAWDSHLIAALFATTRPAEALRWAEAALAESEPIGYVYGINASYRALGVVTTELGELREAATWFLRALDAFTRSGGVMERRATLAAALPLLVQTGQESLATSVLDVVDGGEGVVERISAPRLDEVRRTLGAARRATDVPSPPVDGHRVLAAVREHLRSLAAESSDAVPGPRAPAAAPPVAGVLRRTGDLWTVIFHGTSAPVRRSKGLEDIAVLLARPGQDVPALDLASGGGVAASASMGEDLHEPGDLGEVVDATARAAYSARIKELQSALDDADAAGDAERGARLQAELDELTRHLAAAYGLHGPRRAGDPAERARAAVTARIRAAIAKVGEAHPPLGRHLSHSIRTGRFCSYRPDEPVAWTIAP